MLSLNEINIFVAVAETGSFSQTARNLHLSQPAISQAIQSLEKRLSTELFHRQGRRIRLSDAGHRLLPVARDLLTTAQHFEDSVEQTRGIVAGCITMGCGTASGKYLMPQVIQGFQKTYPHVRIDITYCGQNVLDGQLLSGELDFVLKSQPTLHSDLESRQIAQDRLILVVSPDHEWATRESVNPCELTQTSFILREATSGTSSTFSKALMDHDLNRDMLDVKMILANTEALLMAVEQNMGVTVVSELATQHSLKNKRLVTVPIENMPMILPIYLVRNLRETATVSKITYWEYILKLCS